MLRRRNYVTPTSYLELILTFKSLLGVKREEVKTLQNRYLNGLEKLSFAASQVDYVTLFTDMPRFSLFSVVWDSVIMPATDSVFVSAPIQECHITHDNQNRKIA